MAQSFLWEYVVDKGADQYLPSKFQEKGRTEENMIQAIRSSFDVRTDQEVVIIVK